MYLLEGQNILYKIVNNVYDPSGETLFSDAPYVMVVHMCQLWLA